MDLIYYQRAYNSDEEDKRRFNLSIFDESVLEEKKFCENCVRQCSFCEYSMCTAHKHSIDLPWFEDAIDVCWECYDFHNKSFHFSHVLSGKVQFQSGTFDETVIEEAETINNNNQPFQHRSEEEVREMTDDERLRYFQLKYLIYKHVNGE